ncbi:hypothetical protein LEP1GSC195_3648 [Leptospira wolbachii serovar Codice str. CDC]|uniref:Uncharacterized protein n=1 Tax=Leptospira wolbachii serovar Codice str. CDC TaxID=1218599 RepID=R9A475_9LEPT|nr:hypothetical protein LEP1GSC195_3648 [Leptospira wolbachii serovar Codice str. CDC]
MIPETFPDMVEKEPPICLLITAVSPVSAVTFLESAMNW